MTEPLSRKDPDRSNCITGLWRPIGRHGPRAIAGRLALNARPWRQGFDLVRRLRRSGPFTVLYRSLDPRLRRERPSRNPSGSRPRAAAPAGPTGRIEDISGERPFSRAE